MAKLDNLDILEKRPSIPLDLKPQLEYKPTWLSKKQTRPELPSDDVKSFTPAVYSPNEASEPAPKRPVHEIDEQATEPVREIHFPKLFSRPTLNPEKQVTEKKVEKKTPPKQKGPEPKFKNAVPKRIKLELPTTNLHLKDEEIEKFVHNIKIIQPREEKPKEEKPREEKPVVTPQVLQTQLPSPKETEVSSQVLDIQNQINSKLKDVESSLQTLAQTIPGATIVPPASPEPQLAPVLQISPETQLSPPLPVSPREPDLEIPEDWQITDEESKTVPDEPLTPIPGTTKPALASPKENTNRFQNASSLLLNNKPLTEYIKINKTKNGKNQYESQTRIWIRALMKIAGFGLLGYGIYDFSKIFILGFSMNRIFEFFTMVFVAFVLVYFGENFDLVIRPETDPYKLKKEAPENPFEPVFQ